MVDLRLAGPGRPRRCPDRVRGVIDVRALLLTGIFGTGKSSVAEEIAELLEASEQRYAAIDLDWLGWSNVDGSGHDEHEILARNLAAVVGIYREAGAQRFVLAGSVEDAARLEAIRAAIDAPLTVVKLTAPLDVIEERLGSSPTSGRADDLARARVSFAAGAGAGLEDVVIENTGPIRETALRVLEAAGWLPAGSHVENVRRASFQG
jgi:adenylylsulfate kinase